MNNLKIIINSIGSVLLSITSYLFGGLDSSFLILVVFLITDYISGVSKAIYFKNINSRIGIKGIIKKIGYLSIVVLAVGMDKVMGSGTAIRSLIIYFFIANEGISILENWGSMGLPLPKKIFAVLEILKKKGEDKDE